MKHEIFKVEDAPAPTSPIGVTLITHKPGEINKLRDELIEAGMPPNYVYCYKTLAEIMGYHIKPISTCKVSEDHYWLTITHRWPPSFDHGDYGYIYMSPGNTRSKRHSTSVMSKYLDLYNHWIHGRVHRYEIIQISTGNVLRVSDPVYGTIEETDIAARKEIRRIMS